MPVGKPTPDGEIGPSPRHGSHKGGLGAVVAWNCPACGTKNEGRRPEQGCAHCGAGDPTKSQAGQPVEQKESSVGRQPRTPSDVVAAPTRPVRTPATVPSVEQVKIYRLIEYVMDQPAGFQETLRRSLVGTMQLDWGTITATIVDSLDSRQEDLLRMARMQPGVWLGNATLSNPAGTVSYAEGVRSTLEHFEREHQKDHPHQYGTRIPLTKAEAFEIDRYMHRSKTVDAPDTGPVFSEKELELAKDLRVIGNVAMGGEGFSFIHTLALALSNVAMELEGNMEPLKFMESAACLRLANALMSLIPNDWDPQPETKND